MLDRMGINVVGSPLRARATPPAVMVTANLPAFAAIGRGWT